MWAQYILTLQIFIILGDDDMESDAEVFQVKQWRTTNFKSEQFPETIERFLNILGITTKKARLEIVDKINFCTEWTEGLNVDVRFPYRLTGNERRVFKGIIFIEIMIFLVSEKFGFTVCLSAAQRSYLINQRDYDTVRFAGGLNHLNAKPPGGYVNTEVDLLFIELSTLFLAMGTPWFWDTSNRADWVTKMYDQLYYALETGYQSKGIKI